MAKRPYDSAGNLRPLRQRNPVAYWMAMLMVVALVATGFTALISAIT